MRPTHLTILPVFALCLFSLAVPSVIAQETNQNTTEADDNESTGLRHLWVAKMQAGNYQVLVNKITSISKHEYISDGAARVVEVTISTHSSVAARFYYLEPVTDNSPLSVGKGTIDRLTGLAKEGAGRAGVTDELNQVIKNYPLTTHAHTVEFRLRSVASLNSLYNSLARVMESGRGRTFSEPAE